MLEQRLRENALLERTTALVFDDIDAAPDDVVDGVTRLATAVEPRFARTLVVATTQPEGWGRLPEPLRHRAVVRIELAPWTAELTAGYLATNWTGTGSRDMFTPEACGTIARCAEGVPRDIVSLARLALAAATGDGATVVDAGTVERVWRRTLDVVEPVATRCGRERSHARRRRATAGPRRQAPLGLSVQRRCPRCFRTRHRDVDWRPHERRPGDIPCPHRHRRPPGRGT